MASGLTTSGRSGGALTPLESYLHVIHALMLRDMRTRSAVAVGLRRRRPCGPASTSSSDRIYTFQHIPVPIGNSSPLFFATGAVPVLIFQYISREVMKAVMMNRPLTYYPQVKLFDLILARVLVEIVTGFLGLIVVVSLLTALGVDPRPVHSFVAVTGYLARSCSGSAWASSTSPSSASSPAGWSDMRCSTSSCISPAASSSCRALCPRRSITG